jgi:hypothetical protein
MADWGMAPRWAETKSISPKDRDSMRGHGEHVAQGAMGFDQGVQGQGAGQACLRRQGVDRIHGLLEVGQVPRLGIIR